VTQFIRREFHVQEPDKTKTIRMDAPAPRPTMPGGDVLYIIGLPGSGKSSVAAFLAEKLGRPAAALPLDGADAALDGILAAGPAIVEVPHKLLTSEALRRRLAETGRVLYLMAGVEALAPRLAKSPAELDQVRERLGRQRTAYEPWFMQTLHLMAPVEGPLSEVLADVLERVTL
jgi:shikimate kinase